MGGGVRLCGDSIDEWMTDDDLVVKQGCGVQTRLSKCRPLERLQVFEIESLFTTTTQLIKFRTMVDIPPASVHLQDVSPAHNTARCTYLFNLFL
jgi:hypothetical protein